MPFEGSSLTWMRPPLATSEAALTFSAGATFSFNAWSALIAATRIPGLMLAAVVLPPDIGLTPEAESPISGLTCDGCSPSASAVMTATSVRVPVPRSCVPRRMTTTPSDVISQ